MRTLSLVLIWALSSGPAAFGAESGEVVFSAMADVPYTAEEAAALPGLIAGIDPRSLFLVHLGDITGVGSNCEESVYSEMAARLAESPVPVFVLPGDNEWTDCPDPDEAWQLWTRHFLGFEARWKSGLEVRRQERRPENFAFEHQGVLFIGVNLVGGTVHDPKEWRRRHRDDLGWTREQIRGSNEARAAVVMTHAHPTDRHLDYLGGLMDESERFGRPVLFLHGDGHIWIRDRPSRAQGLLRVQLDAGAVPPVGVTVTDDSAGPFVFDRRLPVP